MGCSFPPGLENAERVVFRVWGVGFKSSGLSVLV